MIHATYTEPQSFTAEDQQPGATRYKIGSLWVDASGPAPTQNDVDVFMAGANSGELKRKNVLADLTTTTILDLLDNKSLAQIDTFVDNQNTVLKLQAVIKLLIRAIILGSRRS